MFNTNVNVKPTVGTKNNKNLNYIKLGIIFLLSISTIMMRINIPMLDGAKYIFFISLAAFAWIHGSQRYGLKNMIIWFVITWIVSNCFEGLSVKTGFPFGHYHYTTPGPRILDVPAYIMIAYFGIAYTSWTITQALTRHFSKKIVGVQKIIIPITTAIIMTMWDIVTDPQASTIHQTWIWENGGDYFGVPISNFVGWVFVVYVFMQIFTLFISTKNLDISKNNVTSKKTYWLEAAIVYLIMGLGVVLEGITHTDHIEIYGCMAMMSVFTVVFVSYISLLNIKNSKELND
ncbi:carotenoid biosynthesis protein [Clostridium sp. YIM B02555]|uniref:carotenoid biosynthesis protein n=1 Tax=Clostridium sp. YIM B02555 TaxID=2911968 RepID=UPI001EED863F|nr:carotenoid biosynthesis protein [Clostridium sp. YIM B02555]